MLSLSLFLPDENYTNTVANYFSTCITTPMVFTFKGNIGAGKTTFIRAMIKALGVDGAIKSPTFSLVESYFQEKYQIHHFDLYRVHDEMELEYIGFRDYFSGNSLCCIEWPEHGSGYLNNIDIEFKMSINGDGRKMEICAGSTKGQNAIEHLKNLI